MGRYTINDPRSASTQAFEQLNQNIGTFFGQAMERKLGEKKRREELEDAIALVNAKTNAEMNSPLGQLDIQSKISTLNKNRLDLGQDPIEYNGEVQLDAATPVQGVLGKPGAIRAPVEMNAAPAENIIGNAPYAKPNLIPETFENTYYGGPRVKTFMNPEAEKAREAVKPETAEAATAATYWKSAVNNIANIKSIVGKPDFDWGPFGALRASTGKATLLTFGAKGNFKSGYDKRTEDVLKIQNSLNELKRAAFGEGGKQLTNIERETIFRTIEPMGQTKEEWFNLLEQSEQILKSKTNMQIRNPERAGIFGNKQINQGLQFSSEAEAEAANLQPGTRITINGRPAIWE